MKENAFCAARWNCLILWLFANWFVLRTCVFIVYFSVLPILFLLYWWFLLVVYPLPVRAVSLPVVLRAFWLLPVQPLRLLWKRRDRWAPRESNANQPNRPYSSHCTTRTSDERKEKGEEKRKEKKRRKKESYYIQAHTKWNVGREMNESGVVSKDFFLPHCLISLSFPFFVCLLHGCSDCDGHFASSLQCSQHGALSLTCPASLSIV